ncbi:MAG TPA: oxygen-independent coproporphyrinogen III oxidase [Acetobacteraceae bacterium]|nr:oxygen-independent coproporphyrinogen III oxidase [Acetobacteraceae bacterium]
MSPDLLQRYDQRVPRYTSYPTAPNFGPGVDSRTYKSWLAALPDGTALSLYLHVPFCVRLCLFCGCHTRAARREAPLLDYGALLETEIDRVADAIGRRLPVRHVHWGGGTPTSLPPAAMLRVAGRLAVRFDLRPDAEIAVEIDPRAFAPEHAAALREIGITRASVGVQDFHPAVQQAIGRIQPFEMTARAILSLRESGAGSINLDMLYGLPRQTVASVERTAEQAAALRPDRIAVFGYAHVPWIKRHQAAIDADALPGTAARLAQRAAADAVLREAGLAPVGLDHYARPGDALAQAAAAGRLRRNFQGYTTDDADALIGFGASAIGRLPQGYVQNIAHIGAWQQAVRAGRLPVARGIALTDEDRRRGAVIEALMCSLKADLAAAPDLLEEAAAPLAQMERDGIVSRAGTTLAVTAEGRPLVRNVAALFDAYLRPGEQRHAKAI